MAGAPKTIGRYELIEPIGQGGMGTVYRARDPMIDRLVAVKTIDFSDSGDPSQRQELRDRVLREASAAGALSHPNIVTVHDVGEIDSRAYIVMEFVDGVTLWQLRESGEAISRKKIVDILQQTAAALDYAHARGIIHRDVKPGNIMVTRDGKVKIADFGIARMLSGEKLTRTGMIVGTPHYMAPEQLGASEIGPASDQFALAINAYEALTGKKPFDADNFSTLLAMILKEDPAPMQSIEPGIPAAADAAIKRAFQKDPKKRYPSCTAMGEALGRALGTDSLSFSAADPVPEQRSGVSKPAWVAGAVVIAVLAGWMALSSGTPDAAPGAIQQGRPAEVGTSSDPAAEPGAVASVDTSAEDSPAASEADVDTSDGPENSGAMAANSPASDMGSQATRKQASIRAAPPSQPANNPDPPPAQPSVQENSGPARLVPAGPLVTVVWKGELATNETLAIDGGSAGSGELSRPLPSIPMEVEISPQESLEVVEAPSAANDWARLRIHNTGRSRTLLFIRYRQLVEP